MATKFLRRTWNKYSKLGKKRKKKQVWRKPTGRDNKMREKRKGKPVVVSIGYGKVEKKKIFVVKKLEDLKHAGKDAVLGRIGKRKKIEMCKKAREKGIKFSNIDVEKFLSKNTKEDKKDESK